MTTKFQDIKITGMNDAATRRSDAHSGLFTVVLDLSAIAPSPWANYFNDSWRQHLYMMKRRASVAGAALEIECGLDELESDHLPELKKIIDETNKAYARHVADVAQAEDALKKQTRTDKQQVADAKKTIKFD